MSTSPTSRKSYGHSPRATIRVLGAKLFSIMKQRTLWLRSFLAMKKCPCTRPKSSTTVCPRTNGKANCRSAAPSADPTRSGFRRRFYRIGVRMDSNSVMCQRSGGRLLSVDQFAATEDTLFFEASVSSSLGEERVYDAFVLRDGKVTHHFTGIK